MTVDKSTSRESGVRQKIKPVQFGKYLLTERIGVGGMAQAYRATTSWAEGVAKEVCVKRILAPLAANQRMREMFIQEARIAASLTHANIVPVYEFGVVEGYYFLAMEYVEGYTLREIMMQCARRRKWLDLAVVLHLMCEALEGLDYAHRKRDADGNPLQIVHRDMTPGNVMASVEGEVKILDFGIAWIAPAAGELPAGRGTHGSSGLGHGKPGYMSPEQAVGMAVDGRSDIFSLGILLHEMLTHRRLFKDMTIADRVKQAAKVPAPSSINADVPPVLDAIVLAALSPKPADRHPTAAAFRDALLDYMHDNGLRAGRAQLAQSLADLFGEAPDGRRKEARSWEMDIRALQPEDKHARPPKQQERARSARRISTTVAPVGLHTGMRGVRRARARLIALGGAILAAALAVAVAMLRGCG